MTLLRFKKKKKDFAISRTQIVNTTKKKEYTTNLCDTLFLNESKAIWFCCLFYCKSAHFLSLFLFLRIEFKEQNWWQRTIESSSFEWVVCFLGRSAKHTYKFLFPMDFKVFSALTKKWNSAENSHIPFTWIHQLLTFLPHLLYHSVCVNVCVCQFVYIYTMIFWNHLRVSCRHWGPLNFSWCFLKSKKFSENHGAMIKIRKLNIDTHYILPYLRLYVNFINCALPTPS